MTSKKALTIMLEKALADLDEVCQDNANLFKAYSTLKATRIRFSVYTDLGVRPIYDMSIDMAILARKMTGPTRMPEAEFDIVSQWPEAEFDMKHYGEDSHGYFSS